MEYGLCAVTGLTALSCASKYCTLNCTYEMGGKVMDTISYTAARASLAKTMEKVCDDHAPVIITRKQRTPCGDAFS